jgi:hypothetical protein
MTDPAHAADAHITRGYWGVIKELMVPSASTSAKELVKHAEFKC